VRRKRDGYLVVLSAVAVSLVLLVTSVSRGPGVAAGEGAVSPALDCPSCDDFNRCTVDSCDATTGTCRHDPLSCDDNNPCTMDSCDSSSFPFPRGCVHDLASAGTACSDGSTCTTGDICDGSGVCIGQIQPAGSDCDDGNSCTGPDACDEAGQCLSQGTLAPGSACDDGSLCTLGDVCVSMTSGAVVCQGALKTCDDGDLCTRDTCDASTGECGVVPVNCDDGNACTNDACDPATGACTRTGISAPCSDGNFCTVNDACSGGNCIGSERNCDDNTSCTTDLCINDVEGCRHFPDPSLCDDHNLCTFDDCDPARGCVSMSVPSGTSCDTNPTDCIKQECLAGRCMTALFLPEGVPCSDNNVCTTGDVCGNRDGICRGTPVCDDGDPCTIDTCDPVTGACTHAPNSGACDDGNACTIGETCTDAVCGGGAPVSCDDGNSCTLDTCDPVTGACAHAPNSGACDDGNACTIGETCTDAVCGGGAPVSCDDANACTLDACDPVTGACAHTPNSGACDDHNACTADGCDSAVGCTHSPIPGPPDGDSDGITDSCDNCPATSNPRQDDCNGNGFGDACDPSLYGISVITDSSIGKGAGLVVWNAQCELDLVGYNVIRIDNQGRRTQLNPALIECNECVTGRNAYYEIPIPKHRGAQGIYLEVLYRSSPTLTVGPAVKQ
jgi:Dictyostelium (slime mold) repeat